jgi:hypothetical protein
MFWGSPRAGGTRVAWARRMNSTLRPCFSFALSALLLVGALAACTSDPTAEDVVNRATPVICEKTKECRGEALFSLAYPGGTDECVSKTKEQVSRKYGDDLDRRSTCTEEELEKCLDDFKAAKCGDSGELPPVPCDC